MGISLKSPFLNSTSRTAPCGPSGPKVFPLERTVRPPALPARRTAEPCTSTLWLLPGSIKPDSSGVPSPARMDTQDGSEATSSTRVEPATDGVEGFDTTGAGVGVVEATGVGTAFTGGAGTGVAGRVTGPAGAGSEAAVTWLLLSEPAGQSSMPRTSTIA